MGSVTLELSMGAALSNVPLCSRAGGDDVDSNNNLHTETDNNQARAVVVDSQPAPVQTSTPKLEREAGGDSQQDSLDFGPGSDRTFGSDSGLEHSGDELELSRYVLDLDAAVDTEEEDEEDEDENGKDEETLESLQSGDLGIDRSTTFRVIKKEEEEEQRENVLRKLDDLESVDVSSRLSALTVILTSPYNPVLVLVFSGFASIS